MIRREDIDICRSCGVPSFPYERDGELDSCPVCGFDGNGGSWFTPGPIRRTDD